MTTQASLQKAVVDVKPWGQIKGERVHALQKHQEWMVDKGIDHINPRDSEYF